MYDSVINKKVPPYAPYVMKLIKAKYPFSDDVTDPDVELTCETHGRVKMNRKSAHLSRSASSAAVPLPRLVSLLVLRRAHLLRVRLALSVHGSSVLLRRFCA